MKIAFYTSLILPAVYIGLVIVFFLGLIFGYDIKDMDASHIDLVFGIIASMTLFGVAGSLLFLWMQRLPLLLKLKWSCLLLIGNMISIPYFLWNAKEGRLLNSQITDNAEQMKSKLDKRSYLFGILMGVVVGISGGYWLAISQGLHRIGTDQDAEVALCIATLRKLENNDTASASRLLRHIIAIDYLEHSRMADSSWIHMSYRNKNLINHVEAAANELPSLKQTIDEERSK